jgi:hypothetical protein
LKAGLHQGHWVALDGPAAEFVVSNHVVCDS